MHVQENDLAHHHTNAAGTLPVFLLHTVTVNISKSGISEYKIMRLENDDIALRAVHVFDLTRSHCDLAAVGTNGGNDLTVAILTQRCNFKMEAALKAVEQEVSKISQNINEKRSADHYKDSKARLEISLNFLRENFPESERTKKVEQIIIILLAVCAKHIARENQHPPQAPGAGSHPTPHRREEEHFGSRGVSAYIIGSEVNMIPDNLPLYTTYINHRYRESVMCIIL